jgi:hypothetical protein
MAGTVLGEGLWGVYRPNGKDTEGTGEHALQKPVSNLRPDSDGKRKHHESTEYPDIGPEAHLLACLIEQLAFLEREFRLPTSTPLDSQSTGERCGYVDFLSVSLGIFGGHCTLGRGGRAGRRLGHGRCGDLSQEGGERLATMMKRRIPGIPIPTGIGGCCGDALTKFQNNALAHTPRNFTVPSCT